MISADDRDLSVALAKLPGPLCRPPAPAGPAAAKSPEGPIPEAKPAVPQSQIGDFLQSAKWVRLDWFVFFFFFRGKGVWFLCAFYKP